MASPVKPVTETAYDPTAYWLERGGGYRNEKRLESERYRQQEIFIGEAVRTLAPKSILEVGCGYGRITKAIADKCRTASMLATDISADQIREARTFCAGLSQVKFKIQDLYAEPPGGGFDLVVAIEVFLHHPLPAVAGFVERLLSVSPAILHEYDLSAIPGCRTAPHCFNHDYAALYRAMGLNLRVRRRGELAVMIVQRSKC